MVTAIFHGDDVSASRLALGDYLTAKKQQALASGQEIVVERVDASQIGDLLLERLQSDEELFGAQKFFVLENLHASAKSARRDQFIARLAELPNPLVVWERKKLTALMLKAFPQAKVRLFLAKNHLWQFLGALKPGMDASARQALLRLYYQALQENDPYYLLVMICWQWRQLLAASASAAVTAKLLRIHQGLLDLDDRYKTSRLALPFAASLAWFLDQEWR